MNDQSQIGLTGLAVMGANLARNIARHGYSIAVHNRTASKTTRVRRGVRPRGRDHRHRVGRGVRRRARAAAQDHHHGQGRRPGRRRDRASSPRCSTRATSSSTRGNSHFRDTERRAAECADRGLRFVGMGVSGGEEGALKGPSIMPGGDRGGVGRGRRDPDRDRGRRRRHAVLRARRAGRRGPLREDGPQRHRVRRHAADRRVLRPAAQRRRAVDVDEIAAIFDEWNRGDLESFLIEITADGARAQGRGDRRAARRRDPRPGRAEGHRPLDQPGRARARRPADRDHRGRLRPRALVAASDERVAAAGDPRRPEARRATTTTTGHRRRHPQPRSTRARSSPTRRASSRCAPRRRRTTGTSTSARWPRSGAAAASSARASSTGSATPTRAREVVEPAHRAVLRRRDGRGAGRVAAR